MEDDGKRKRPASAVADLVNDQLDSRIQKRSRLDVQAQEAFIGNFKVMTEDLSVKELLPELLKREILSHIEADEVMSKDTRRDQNYRLLCTIHRKACANPGLLVAFREALESINISEPGCSLEHIIKGLCCSDQVLFTTNHSTQIEEVLHSMDARHILPELISRRVITVEESEEVNSIKTTELRNGRLFDIVVHSGKFSTFLEVLESVTGLTVTSNIPREPHQQTICNAFPTTRTGRPESKAFKRAMGKLGSSLTEKDVDELTRYLYSHDIISKSFRDELLNPMSHRTQLLRTNNLLCHLESKIKDSPSVYDTLIEIFAEELHFQTPASILRSCRGESVENPTAHTLERDSNNSYLSSETYKCLPASKQISAFSQQLMDLYKSHKVALDQKWSCTNNTVFYINLAIIMRERITIATADPFTRETIERNEDVDSILKRKQQIDMEDVLKPEVGGAKVRLQIILVQGAAGVGKSTFALEMAKKWSVFKEMKSFQLVLLVQLRQPLAHRASSIHDLLQLYGHQDPALLDQIAKFIVQQDGENLLLILDGFDELPSEVISSKMSFYIQLLQGDYLAKATIILTTRPSVISCVQKMFQNRISKYIEIVGFLSTQVDEFAHKCLTNEQAESFLKYIYSYPHIKSMMYIPLNTAIMVKLYCNCTSHKDKALPMTLTQLYAEFCLYLLQCCVDARQLEYNQQCPEEQDFYSELRCMPDNIQRQMKRLAEVAFCGISEHMVVFYDLPMEFDHMDFMNKCERLVYNRLRLKPSVSYNFLHLTVQEFLAAYHISCQPVEEQVKLLRLHSSKQHFSRVWRFLAGLTAFNGIGWDVFNSIMNTSRCGSDMKICKSLLVNCLYEAQDPSICSQVLFDCCAVYSPMSVTHYDYYSLGYCVANCPCTWKLCGIGGDGLAMLAAGIKSSDKTPKGKVVLVKLSYNGEKISDLLELPECMRKDITELNLGNCGLTDDACNSLSRILEHFPTLNRLDIADNPFVEGGATSLLTSLSQYAKINYLDLLHAKLNFDDLDALSALIRGTLENLVIGSTTMHIRVVEKMLKVILADSQLKNLSIMNLDLALFGAQLGKKLEENKTLDTLNLWDRSFCIEGCIEVVRALEKNHSLKFLTLMPWYKFHIPKTLFISSNNRINWFIYPKQI